MVRSLLSLSIFRSRCAPSPHSLLNAFLATRASHLRRTENRTTSNPQSANVDAADAASSLSPLPATLTKNTRGGVYLFPPKNLFSSFSRLLARHSSLATTSFTIRTSGKHARNPIGMNSSKTQHLKLFRMNTYKKTGEGAPTALDRSTAFGNPPAGYNSAQPSQELASTPPASSTLPVAQGFAEQGTTSAIVEGAKLRKRKDAPRGVPGGRCDE
jgi:hypothetical protein